MQDQRDSTAQGMQSSAQNYRTQSRNSWQNYGDSYHGSSYTQNNYYGGYYGGSSGSAAWAAAGGMAAGMMIGVEDRSRRRRAEHDDFVAALARPLDQPRPDVARCTRHHEALRHRSASHCANEMRAPPQSSRTSSGCRPRSASRTAACAALGQ